MNLDQDRNDIAVIGMSGAFPGAANVEQLWLNLLSGHSGIRDISDEDCEQAGIPATLYQDPRYVKRSAFIDSAPCFDAGFFGYSDAEAEMLDPQHRVFLQHAWSALESACYIPDQVPGMVGVFAACGFNRYLINKLSLDTNRFDIEDFQKMLASDKDFLATRVSYKLNLKGPSISVQSGCSSSLVAVQMGCTALQTYQCDLALCGGVTLNVPHKAGYRYTDGLIFSPDGHCRPFTDEANGTVFGEGVGVVVLKRLHDAVEDDDNIIAVIRGAAVNNDGREKVGYTAPSAQGQSDVIELAQALAGVEPESLHYIETHGTGTKLGDPIEISGLKEVFAGAPIQSCALGALKADIGHLDAAAGIAGFIKATLVVHHKCIPPMRFAKTISSALAIEQSPFYFNEQSVDLSQHTQTVTAGVSSFGVGGTNAHVVVTSPPEMPTHTGELGHAFCVVSARSPAAVKRYQRLVADFATRHPHQIPALAHTFAKARKLFDVRSYVVLSALSDKTEAHFGATYKASHSPKTAFLFSGQGMQFTGMARALYDSDGAFRSLLDTCLKKAECHTKADLRSLVLADNPTSAQEELVNHTENSQPALFITEYALAKSLMERGIQPQVMIGHSLGEYAAACIAGVMSLDDAIRLVCLRGRLMNACEPSGMLAVNTTLDSVNPLLNNSLEISLLNARDRIVVSGSLNDLAELQQALQSKGIECRKLNVSHAFHSRFMEPMLEEYRHAFETVRLQRPSIAIISMCGDGSSKDAPLDQVDYWLKHLREPVNFVAGTAVLLDQAPDICLEIGPGNGLQSLVLAHPQAPDTLNCISSIKRQTPGATGKTLVELAVELWCAGAEVSLDDWIPPSRFIDAPTYPFEPTEYWLPNISKIGQSILEALSTEDASIREQITDCWSQVFGRENIADDENFIDLGGDSLLGVRLANLLTEKLGKEVNISTIVRFPSIKAMVAHFDVDVDDGEAHFPTMFSIDKRGDGEPIFLVSGAHEDRYVKGGHSNYEEDAYRYFSTLVQHLGGNRPVYGFRPRGIFIEEEFHPSVEAMATECISQIKEVQPQGPYIIGGECVGGVVAYEMARQLLASGEEVKSLVLMDTHFPSPLFRVLETSRVKLRRGKRRLLSLLKILRTGDWPLFAREVNASLAYLSIFLFPYNEKRHHLRNAIFGSQIYLDLLLRYQPKPLPITVHILVNQEWWEQNQTLDWQKLRGGDIEVQAVPGDHKTRLTTYGEQLGELINGLIE